MARRLRLDHPQTFFISNDEIRVGVRETQSKAPRCAVDELIKNPHWPRPLGRGCVHKALKKYRAELVNDEPEYKWIGPAGPLDRNAASSHAHQAQDAQYFAYAIYDLLVPNPGITIHWVRQIIHEYCLGSCEVSRRTNRYWNSRRWHREKAARRLKSMMEENKNRRLH